MPFESVPASAFGAQHRFDRVRPIPERSLATGILTHAVLLETRPAILGGIGNHSRTKRVRLDVPEYDAALDKPVKSPAAEPAFYPAQEQTPSLSIERGPTQSHESDQPPTS